MSDSFATIRLLKCSSIFSSTGDRQSCSYRSYQFHFGQVYTSIFPPASLHFSWLWNIWKRAITNIANYGCGHDSRPDSQSSMKGVRLHALADTVAAPRGKVLTVVMHQVVSRQRRRVSRHSSRSLFRVGALKKRVEQVNISSLALDGFPADKYFSLYIYISPIYTHYPAICLSGCFCCCCFVCVCLFVVVVVFVLFCVFLLLLLLLLLFFLGGGGGGGVGFFVCVCLFLLLFLSIELDFFI